MFSVGMDACSENPIQHGRKYVTEGDAEASTGAPARIPVKQVAIVGVTKRTTLKTGLSRGG